MRRNILWEIKCSLVPVRTKLNDHSIKKKKKNRSCEGKPRRFAAVCLNIPHAKNIFRKRKRPRERRIDAIDQSVKKFQVLSCDTNFPLLSLQSFEYSYAQPENWNYTPGHV